MAIDRLVAVPKDLQLIEFPTEDKLDPVGWLKNFYGVEMNEMRSSPELVKKLQTHLMKYSSLRPAPARVIPWEEINLEKIIAVNRRLVKLDQPIQTNEVKNEPAKKKVNRAFRK